MRIGVATLIGSGDSSERGVVHETPKQGVAAPNTVIVAERTRRLNANRRGSKWDATSLLADLP